MMYQVNGPGLPQWPTLWYDAEQGVAVVTAKAVGWRSYLRGLEWSCRLNALVYFGGIAAWVALVFSKPPAAVVEQGTAVFVVVVPLGLLFICLVLRPKLIRWCGDLVQIAFTQEVVVHGGVKHPRQYGDLPVAISFRITGDPEANEKLELDQKLKDHKKRYKISTARRVQLVVQAGGMNPRSGAIYSGPGTVFTVANLLGDEQAEQFSSVCMAAAQMTAGGTSGPRPPEEAREFDPDLL